MYAIIIASALSAVAAHAQIIYTDIPDVTIAKVGAIYSLDLNNDGTKDYEFRIEKSTVSSYCGSDPHKKTNYDLNVYPFNGNETTPSSFSLNSAIGSTGISWSTSSPQTMVYSVWSCFAGIKGSYSWAHIIGGDWINVNDKYLGLKLHVASTVYYGWARCSTTIDNTGTKLTLTIKDYAYNSIPNQSILAGQTSAVVTQVQKKAVINDEDKIDKERISNYPNPFSNSTTISFFLAQSGKASVEIFDMAGRLVKVLANTEMQAGSHQLIWNGKDEKENAPGAGMYIVQIQSGNYTKTKKLSLVK